MHNPHMFCFADTDCLLKLAAADLWDEALKVLGVTSEDVRINTEPGDKLIRQQTKFEKKLTPKGYRRALAIINKLSLVSTIPNATEELLLNNILNIDPGEIVLICATRDVPIFCLISGDRKWPRALAEQRHLHDVRGRLAGNCICLEQIILRLIESADSPDYQTIKHRILCIPDCRNSLDCIFVEGDNTSKIKAIRALHQRIKELRDVSGDLLAQG